jgi:glycerophosphoryl diester phosphodiesterase
MLAISHRGYNGPDNSKKAFQNAIQANFDVIETDVHKSFDNKLLLIHDRFVGPYDVEATYSNVLQNYDKNILTLEEFFQYFSANTHKIYLDIKGSNETAHLLVHFLKSHYIETTNLFIASTNRNHLHTCLHSGLNLKLGLITFNTFLSTELGYILQNVDFIVVDIECLSQDYVKTLKNHNRKLFVYTCKNENHYEFIKPFKVDGIVSDILLDL